MGSEAGLADQEGEAFLVTKEEAIEKADQWMRDHGNGFSFRSCWNCNRAHEHLRNAEYVILCFVCGHYFFNGVDITEEEKS